MAELLGEAPDEVRRAGNRGGTKRSALPRFLGATLRGALGYLLRLTICQVAHGDCPRCLLQTACAYPAVFEGLAPSDRKIMRKYDKIPQPFVLLVRGPQSNEQVSTSLTWGLRLFGDACRYWPYLVHVYRMAGERGIGKNRVQYQIRQVTDQVGQVVLWSPAESRTPQPVVGLVPEEMVALPDHCTLHWKFHTPARVLRGPGRLGGLDLLLSGRRRFQIMDYFYGTPQDESRLQPEEHLEAGEFETIESRLRPWRLQRYSGRQGRRMTLRGLIGDIVIEGPWGRSGAWLQAAPLLHLGKATSFGFGRVTWEVL